MTDTEKQKHFVIVSPISEYTACDAMDLILKEESGVLMNKPLILLCNCGKTSAKPFCDGTHWREKNLK